MIEVPFRWFRELEADFSGSPGKYVFHLQYPKHVSLYTAERKLRYFILKKAVEAAQNIRVMAVQQTVLIFVGANNG